MRKQTVDRVKKTLIILLLVSLALSLTAASVSACSSAGKATETQEKSACATSHSQLTDSCSNIGETCVPDNVPGTHCCQYAGAPELCVYQRCKACIPHGEEVPPRGTQICCDAKDGDIPVLDPSGKVVCGIPG